MKQDTWKQMYGSTPESFKRRVAFALKETEGQSMKRKLSVRTVLIAAIILILLTAVAYAAFSSQVAGFFGRLYGSNTQNWLEKGDVAVLNQSFTLDEAVFTLEEVVYRNNGLYGVGTIRPQEGGSTVIIPEDVTPDEPYGYDFHGAGGMPEKAPANAPTIADIVREKDGRLLVAFVRIDEIGVDGGAMLSPGTVGYGQVPERDGSIRFSFELSDAYAVQEGETYTLKILAFVFEMTIDGKMLEDTRHGEYWTVEIKPASIHDAGFQDSSTPLPSNSVSASMLSLPEIIVPDAYTKTGTLPIYRATARNFGDGLQPEIFNQSGVVSRENGKVVFADESVLSWAPEALFYKEYSGVYDVNAGTGYDADYIPRAALSSEIADLASWAITGWPETGTVYKLQRTALPHITLDEAKAALEMLLAQLGLTGYVCDYALDMSLERIAALGNDMNAMIDSGQFFTNIPKYDYSLATAEDEGFYLSYHKPGDRHNQGNGDLFSVYAYVTQRGIVQASIRDMYIPGEVYAIPEALTDPEKAINSLPAEMAASRFPARLVSVDSIQLTYAPMRAADKADGMVLSPIWLIIYQSDDSVKRGYRCWAEFDAVDGKLLNAIFK
jgi:hypothetical protein